MLATLSESVSLERAYPFSAAPNHSEVQIISESLLDILRLKGHVTVVEANVSTALKIESYFRRCWWSGGDDPFKQAVHACKFQAHTQRGAGAAVSQAWSNMNRHVLSLAWRDHIRKLSEGRTEEHRCYLRLAFRAAQQLWTRAARWEAAFSPGPNPFIPMVRLFERSCWPMGWRDGSLWVCRFCPQDEPGGDVAFAEFTPPHQEPDARAIFLSAPFGERVTQAVLDQIKERGWTVVYGRVHEHVAPEPQLGARIMSASITLGTVLHLDPDFGVPWWTFQEMDLAQACGRPIALLAEGSASNPQNSFKRFSMNDYVIEERFWQWLNCTSQSH